VRQAVAKQLYVLAYLRLVTAARSGSSVEVQDAQMRSTNSSTPARPRSSNAKSWQKNAAAATAKKSVQTCRAARCGPDGLTHGIDQGVARRLMWHIGIAAMKLLSLRTRRLPSAITVRMSRHVSAENEVELGRLVEPRRAPG
jgi:hypothetical protein